MENNNYNNGQQWHNFPAGNHSNFSTRNDIYHYQSTPMNMNMQHEQMNIHQFRNNVGPAFGSGVGWAHGGQQMITTIAADDYNIDFNNPGQLMQHQQQIISFLGNGVHQGNDMYRAPESALIPMPEPEPPMKPPMRSRMKAAKRWSPEEHKLFLIGLKKYKQGDWKSISRYMVVTRSPTQVASHAQKYYIRRKAEAEAEALVAPDAPTRKKRSSIHDIKLEQVNDDPDEIKSLQDIVIAQHSKSKPL